MPLDNSPSQTGRARCLIEAHKAVCARAGAYGLPVPFFFAVARRWSSTLGVDVTARQVALCMLDLKQQRACAGGGPDTSIDIAGYAACLYELEEFFASACPATVPTPPVPGSRVGCGEEGVE